MTLSFDITLSRGGFRLDARGELGDGITVLFGPSGAGKSLLLSALAGLLKTERAKITLNGAVLEDSAAGVRLAPHLRGLGLMFQAAQLFPHLNVVQNIEYAQKRAPPGRAMLKLEDAAQRFDFTDLLYRNVGALSGGEKARVALARALLSAPSVLMLDEPFAALDGHRRRAFLSELAALHRDYKLPLLVVTHQIEDAAFLADDVIALKQGRIVAQGPAARTFAEPVFQDLLDPRDKGAAVTLGSLRAWVRADHVLLASERPHGLSARYLWPGIVRSITDAVGATILVALDTDQGRLFAHITPDAARDLNLQPTQEIWAIVKAHAAH